MRHRKANKKLGRSPEHREALLAALVCALIERKRIRTTLRKAKLASRLADRMITLAKQNTLAARKRAIARLRKERFVTTLFADIGPQFQSRQGGYTRIVKLGRRASDSSEMVLLELVGIKPPERKPRPGKPESEKK